MPKVEINGCNSPQRFDLLRSVLREHFNYVYRQGTDQCLLVDYARSEDASKVITALNAMPGITAAIRKDWQSA